MDLKNLTTFIHVAELNSFSKAALALGYSQSTVSFQIRQLETELNAQLFERIHHTVALTEKGREVLNYAHRIRRMTMELTETMEGQQDLKDIFGWLWRILSVIPSLTAVFLIFAGSTRGLL